MLKGVETDRKVVGPIAGTYRYRVKPRVINLRQPEGGRPYAKTVELRYVAPTGRGPASNRSVT